MADIILMAKVAFFCGVVGWIIYMTHNWYIERMENSLSNAFRTLAESARIGEAPESALKRISEMKNEACSVIFRKVLKKVDEGKSFAQGMHEVSNKYHSKTLKFLSTVLIDTQKSGADVYDIMGTYPQKLWKLKHYETYAKNSVTMNILVVKIMCIGVLPAIFYYFPSILEDIFIPGYVYYFLAGYGAILGLYNWLIYNDYIASLINVPLLSSIPILLPIIFEKVAIF